MPALNRITENVEQPTNSQRENALEATQDANSLSSQRSPGSENEFRTSSRSSSFRGTPSFSPVIADPKVCSFREKRNRISPKRNCLFEVHSLADLKLAVDFPCTAGERENCNSGTLGIAQSVSRKKSQLVLSAVESFQRLGEDNYQFLEPLSTHNTAMLSALLSRFDCVLHQYNDQIEKNLNFLSENKVEKKRSDVQSARVSLDRCVSEARKTKEKKSFNKAAAPQSKLLLNFLEEAEGGLLQWRKMRKNLLLQELMALDARKEKYQDLQKHLSKNPLLRTAFAECSQQPRFFEVDRKWLPFSFLLVSSLKENKETKCATTACSNRSDSIDSQDETWMAQFSHFVERGAIDKAVDLLRTLPLDVVKKDNSLLHRACAVPCPSFELIKTIINLRPELCKGVDCITGNSALHFICSHGKDVSNEGIFRLLIEAGVPVSLRNHAGLTAFHLLVLNQSDAKQHHIMKELLMQASEALRQERVEVDELTTHGQTALHLVCGDDLYLSTTEFLVKHGADLGFSVSYRVSNDTYGVYRMTPLEKSTRCGALRTHQLLRAALKRSQAVFF